MKAEFKGKEEVTCQHNTFLRNKLMARGVLARIFLLIHFLFANRLQNS